MQLILLNRSKRPVWGDAAQTQQGKALWYTLLCACQLFLRPPGTRALPGYSPCIVGGLCRQTPCRRGTCTGLWRWLECRHPCRAGTMYGLAAVARVQTSLPGGDHVRGCGGGSMVFIWAGNLSRDLVGSLSLTKFYSWELQPGARRVLYGRCDEVRLSLAY